MKLKHSNTLLMFENITLKDCDGDEISELFERKLMDIEHRSYDKPPIVFTGLATYPRNTNLLCWNCSRSFKTRPYFEPLHMTPIDRFNYSIACRGNFCSLPCVARHIYATYHSISEFKEKMKMLQMTAEIMLGQRISSIGMAPPHTDRAAYGGTYTDSEYQKIITELEANIVQSLRFDNETINRLFGEELDRMCDSSSA